MINVWMSIRTRIKHSLVWAGRIGLPGSCSQSKRTAGILRPEVKAVYCRRLAEDVSSITRLTGTVMLFPRDRSVLVLGDSIAQSHFPKLCTIPPVGVSRNLTHQGISGLCSSRRQKNLLFRSIGFP